MRTVGVEARPTRLVRRPTPGATAAACRILGVEARPPLTASVEARHITPGAIGRQRTVSVRPPLAEITTTQSPGPGLLALRQHVVQPIPRSQRRLLPHRSYYINACVILTAVCDVFDQNFRRDCGRSYRIRCDGPRPAARENAIAANKCSTGKPGLSNPRHARFANRYRDDRWPVSPRPAVEVWW